MSVGIDKLASELQKVIEEKDKNKKSPYDTEAEVVRVDSDIVWVKIPGGVDETPAQKTVNAKEGDKVQVRVSGGRAFLVGNGTNPPTDDTVANVAISDARDANQNATAAGMAAEQAIESANTANEKAYEASVAAAHAQTDAGIAHTAAEEAKADAAAANTAATQAKADAAEAHTAATEAKEDAAAANTAATEAKADAARANTAANDSLSQLSIVEDVVGTLNWITTHATYKASADIEVHAGKWYFTKSGDTYNVVTNPTGNPSAKGYYEIDTIDEAVSNYVASHLALANEGLYLTKDGNGYKILLANDGLKVYDPEGHLVSTFGESIILDSSRPQTIGNNNVYIKYYDKNNDGTPDSLAIKADEFLLSSGKTIQEELEGVENWFYSVAPTTSNPPASSWTTDKLKEQHLRDIYFDTTSGKSYRWAKEGTTYKWVEIEDVELAALAKDLHDNYPPRSEFTVAPDKIQSTVSAAQTAATNAANTATDNKLKSYYTKTQTDSQITQTANSITSSVSSTYETKTDASSKLNTAKTYAEGKASTAEENAKADTTEKLKSYYTKTQTDSQITQTANSITSTVSSTYETKTDASSKLTEAEGDATTKANKALSDAKADTTEKLKSYSTTTQMNSAIEQKADEINLSVESKTYQAGQPNLSPWFSYIPYEVNDYWKTAFNSLFTYTDMGDGWVRVQCTNTTSSIVRSDPRPIRSESVKPDSDYTFLYEIRNNHSTCTNSKSNIYVVENNDSQFWGGNCKKNLEGARSDTYVVIKDLPQDSSESYIKRFVKTSEPIGSSHWSVDKPTGLCAIVQRCEAGDTIDYELRISIYEGEYTGPYKPYSGTQLYASQSELKVTSDSINLKVSKDDVINQINVSKEGAKISANRIEIDGTATFNAIKAKADAAYDKKGAASAVQTNLDNLEIGGRNLIKATSLESNKIWTMNTCSAVLSDNKVTIENAGEFQQGVVTTPYCGVIKAGTKLTLSCYIYENTIKANRRIYYAKTPSWRARNIPEGFTGLWADTFEAPDDITVLTIDYDMRNRTEGKIVCGPCKLEIGTRATDWTPAPEDIEAAAVAEEQYIYISKASGTTSVNGTTSWVTESGDKQNTWATKRPTYNSSYPVLFVAKQKKVVSGTVTCTAPVKDDTTTIIDGGHITTGTIDSNRLNANTIKVNAANIQGSLTIGQLPSTVAETDDIPTKVSELSNDSGYQNSSQVSSAINNVRSWYATCSTAAGTAAKVATITPTTTAFTTSVLTAGTLVNVKFTVTNTAAVGDLTLNINNTGAKPIRTLRYGVISNIAAVGYLAKNVTYQFTYDGTYWVMQENYNSNTTSQTRWQNNIAAAEAITANHIICGTASGYRNIAANVSFDMAYPLLYAGTAIAKGATSGTRDNNFLEINGVNASTSGTITSGAANKVLFLKGTLTNSTFKIAASPFMTTVAPTSQDNFCYIPLGIMYSATNIYFRSSDQLYAYKDGAFGPVSIREASAAAKTAINYISANSSGIRIASANPATQNQRMELTNSKMSMYDSNNTERLSLNSGTGVVVGRSDKGHSVINDSGLHVYNNTQEVASFGSNARIGAKVASSSYLHLEPNKMSVFGTDDSNKETELFAVGNLINQPIIDSFTGNGTQVSFELTIIFDTDTHPTLTVKVNNVAKTEGTDYTYHGYSYGSYITFKTAPAAGAEITVSYIAAASAPYMTIGTRQASTNVGSYSVAIGKRNTASGMAARSEGYNTTASGNTSHAEGSHTTASGPISHAEGSLTTASGWYAHAEGFSTTASGWYAHAEGNETTATGWYSHTSGQQTIANGRSQTVIGEFNNAQGNSASRADTDYAFIIGNGTADNARSDAFTVDWSGNVNAAGRYYINSKEYISIRRKNWDNLTVNKGATTQFDYSVAVDGYTPIGVVGFDLDNATSSGANMQTVWFSACRLNGDKVLFQLHNNGSANSKVRVWIDVLYRAN